MKLISQLHLVNARPGNYRIRRLDPGKHMLLKVSTPNSIATCGFFSCLPLETPHGGPGGCQK
jgi:hypothetical protein